MKLYQILVMPKGEERWKFVAHGAAYNADDAEAYKAARIESGARIKLLPVKR